MASQRPAGKRRSNLSDKANVSLAALLRSGMYTVATPRRRLMRLNEQTTAAIAAIKLPFSQKRYYSFIDKHLPDGADEELFLDEHDTYYREITTAYEDFRYLAFFYRFYSKPVLCDIGCGIGNVLSFATQLGYTSFGYEINTALQPIHRKLKADVIHGDLVDIDLSRVENADIIYIYRPISDSHLMSKLLTKLHKITKPDVIIIYSFPHSTYIKSYRSVSLSEYDNSVLLLFKEILFNIR